MSHLESRIQGSLKELTVNVWKLRYSAHPSLIPRSHKVFTLDDHIFGEQKASVSGKEEVNATVQNLITSRLHCICYFLIFSTRPLTYSCTNAPYLQLPKQPHFWLLMNGQRNIFLDVCVSCACGQNIDSSSVSFWYVLRGFSCKYSHILALKRKFHVLLVITVVRLEAQGRLMIYTRKWLIANSNFTVQ